MKKKYEKPMIEVESLMLDMPVAAGCDPDGYEDSATLKDMGYFGDGCTRFNVANEKDENLMNYPGMSDDKLCYYSNVIQLFTS